MTMTIDELKGFIREVPDFPKKGILFKDLTPLLAEGPAFGATVDLLAERARPLRPEMIVAVEARGFLFGAALATRLGLGVVPVRKPGKLPWKTRRVEYALEYGTDALEMHHDAVGHDVGVVIVDDLLATGGTAEAAVRLVSEHGARVLACLFVVELSFLGGRSRVAPAAVESLIQY
jgi:adenine phosphoribosyltransferase